jgi:hypothetical protein
MDYYQFQLTGVENLNNYFKNIYDDYPLEIGSTVYCYEFDF